MQPALSAVHFHSEEAAYAYVEARLWPDGPVCPHCGNVDPDRIGKLQGKTTRPGLYKCYACRQPFNVKIGTVFEKSHVPMRVWLQAIYLMSASKKGISTRQLQRTFQCGLKTAWFLGHRVREAMTGMQLDATAGRSAGQTKSSRLTKPTSAAKLGTGRTTFRPRLRCCRWSSATGACAASMCRT